MVPNFKEQALGVLSNFLSVHEVVPGGQNLSLALKSQIVSENHVFATFELPRNSGKTFGVRVFNPVSGSAVAVKLDLLTGGFKLVNFNSYHLGTVTRKDSMLFEAYGASVSSLMSRSALVTLRSHSSKTITRTSKSTNGRSSSGLKTKTASSNMSTSTKSECSSRSKTRKETSPLSS